MVWTGPIFSSILLSLALPNELFPFGLPLVGTVALVPLFLSVYRADHWRSAARLGALFGALSTAVSNYWLAFYGEFSVWTIGGAVLGYAAYNFILFGFLHHLSRRPHFRAIRIATVWAGYEFLKSVGFLGYPWGLIAYPFASSLPLAQLAELTGVWGLSWIGAYTNGVVAELIYRRPRVRRPLKHGLSFQSENFLQVLSVLLIAGTVAAFGVYRLQKQTPVERNISILLVQQNIDSWEPGRFEDALLQAQNLTIQGIDENTKPDLVVWSETAIRRPYDREDRYFNQVPRENPFRSFLRDTDTPLLTGTPIWVSREEYELMNGAALILPDGTTAGTYGKQQLVPFAESIPYYHLAAVKTFFRDVIGLYGSWIPGGDSRTMELSVQGAPLTVGTPICFEDAFGWVNRNLVRNGAQLLINLTNNSWSRQYSAQTQHFAAARLRTIELRTPLVRGTNSGLTAAVDSFGRITSAIPMFTSDTLFVEVSVPERTTTLYQVIGDLFGRLFVAGALLWTYGEYKKNGADPSGSVPLLCV